MMSKINLNLISFLILFNLSFIYGLELNSKITSTTVNTNSPNQQSSLLNVYQPKSDVIYSEPTVDEQKNLKIDLIKNGDRIDLIKNGDRIDLIKNGDRIDLIKNDNKFIKNNKDQLNIYKRPTQFSELIKNQQLIDKQKASLGRNKNLNINKYELNNQFSKSLNYLIKYLNRQGETRLLNGTEYTKNVNNLLLKNARNLDRENCLLRLICEISSNQSDESDNQLINEIRIVFGKKHQAPAYPTKRDDSFPFYYAGHIGASTGNAERCLEIFPVCSARTEQLLQIVSNANKYKLNQTKLNQKSDKIMLNSKLERELYPTLESRKFSEKMHNKMKKLHKQYIKKMN